MRYRVFIACWAQLTIVMPSWRSCWGQCRGWWVGVRRRRYEEVLQTPLTIDECHRGHAALYVWKKSPGYMKTRIPSKVMRYTLIQRLRRDFLPFPQKPRIVIQPLSTGYMLRPLVHPPGFQSWRHHSDPFVTWMVSFHVYDAFNSNLG